MASQAKDDAPSELSAAPATQIGEEEPEAPSATGRWPRAELFRAGETIELGREGARYEIVRPLGRGGMAEVFLARRLGAAGFVREVALKCIMADLEVDERIRRAFLYEARLASRLRHPNIAEAYDLAEVGGRYHLVLEYVDGVSAKSVVQAARRHRRKLSEGFCCHIAASVAEGLHYAHWLTDDDGRPLGIVHRDVTAANVMIGASGAVKLLDFGIAHARVPGRDRTQTGNLKGTYAYFSPEQASGEPMDGRSDLFSLGILLVELLTGRHVFDGGSDVVTIRKISECERVDVEAATSRLSRGLREICEKALAKKPDDRFQEGAEFARALRAYAFERGLSYLASDCVKELRSLGVFAKGSGEVDAEGDPAAEPVGTAVSAGPGVRSSYPVERGTKRQRGRRGKRYWQMLAAAVVAAGVLSPALVMVKRGRGGDPAANKAVETVGREGERTEPALAAPVGQREAAGVAPRSPLADGPVVLPKKAGAPARQGGSVATGKGYGERDRGPRSGATEFADRRSVASASATLVRGTLIPAKLLQPIDPMGPGAVQAMVSEDVVREGVLLVPSGSTIACSSRASKDGRVALSCDSIKTTDRMLSFSGLAVGEGQHVGLRVLDSGVPTGTSFVVYVNAPAAIR